MDHDKFTQADIPERESSLIETILNQNDDQISMLKDVVNRLVRETSLITPDSEKRVAGSLEERTDREPQKGDSPLARRLYSQQSSISDAMTTINSICNQMEVSV